MILTKEILYYAFLAFCIYYTNGGGWRRHIFEISNSAYKELKGLECMFFPKLYLELWKEKWFKPARFIWIHNLLFTSISQIIGIITFIKISTKYQEMNIYYIIPLIFITIIPGILCTLAAIARKVILGDMIEYIERRTRL